MGALVHEFVRFLGASAINFPITGLLVWGLFRALKHKSLSRVQRIFLSYGLAAVALAIMSMYSFAKDITDKRVTQELIDLSIKSGLYKQISIVVWLLVGLRFWGKEKADPPQDSS